MTVPLRPADVLGGLSPRRIPTRVISLDAVSSTNDICWEAARAGEPEGLVVIAERQTEGRGRHGRKWHSSPGLGLATSVLLRPPLLPGHLPLLTAAAAVAAAEAAGAAARIRWPNDVVLRGRKIAGVIVEGREPGAFVLGCGLNVNLLPDDFPAELRDHSTSLRIESGAHVERLGVLRSFLASFDRRYDEALSGSSELPGAWRNRSALVGKRVTIREGGREFCGTVEDLDVLEGITLRLEGSLRRFRLEHVEKLVEGEG